MKQDLKELGPILTEIGDGHEWDYSDGNTSAGEVLWYAPQPYMCPVIAASKGYKIRLKPDELKAAHPVPLGPEDVPPGSVLRSKDWVYGGHVTPSVFLNLVCWINTSGPIHVTYEQLMRGGWEIQRPGQDWQPCSKPAP